MITPYSASLLLLLTLIYLEVPGKLLYFIIAAALILFKVSMFNSFMLVSF